MGTVAEQLEKATRGELVQALSMSVDQNKVYAELSKVQAEQIKTQSEQIETQSEQIETQAEQIEKLQFQLAKLQKMFFGSRSEKSRTLMNPDQMSLFELPAEEAPEPESETITFERKKQATKQHPVRKEIPSHLPRRNQVIEPDNLPEGAVKISEKVTEVVEVTPAKMWVRRIVRPTYRLPDDSIVTAEMPDRWMDRSQAGESTVAHLMTSKFVDHLPIYRQVQQFAREGFDIPESTMNSWMMEGGKLLTPLYTTLKSIILARSYLQADETTIKVLPEKGKDSKNIKKGILRGHLWVYRSPELNISFFQYEPGRSHAPPKAMLENFSGLLQSDGYGVYDAVVRSSDGRLSLGGCWTHARRKYVEAEKNAPKEVAIILRGIGRLYATERIIKERPHSDEEILALRARSRRLLELSKPKLQQLLQVERAQSPLAMAIKYTLKQWDKLLLYTEHARMEIDNNAIENSIRPVAVGRKNYLFAGSEESAQIIAQIYSFFAICKVHGVNPRLWLTDVLARIRSTKPSQYEELLPHKWKPKGNPNVGRSDCYFLHKAEPAENSQS